MSATYSRREQLRDMLVQEFGVISVDNGYRTTPQLVTPNLVWPKDVTNYPTLMLLMGDEEIEQKDSVRSLFTSVVKMSLVGYFTGEEESAGITKPSASIAGEMLLHDVKRCLASIILKYVNSTVNQWHVALGGVKVMGPMYYLESAQGEFTVQFNVRLSFQDEDF